jgi:hypothetical protein
MNATLEALKNAVEASNDVIESEKRKVKELTNRLNEEVRIEQKRMIEKFNKNPFAKLKEIQERLPTKFIISGFKSDTHHHDELSIVISNGMYSYDFVISRGEIMYTTRVSNDGVGCNEYQAIIHIIDFVLNK